MLTSSASKREKSRDEKQRVYLLLSPAQANASLGLWEQAYKDLQAANTMDYDEEVMAKMRDILPKAQRIWDHRNKVHRRRTQR